jgi:hypothetical protein
LYSTRFVQFSPKQGRDVFYDAETKVLSIVKIDFRLQRLRNSVEFPAGSKSFSTFGMQAVVLLKIQVCWDVTLEKQLPTVRRISVPSFFRVTP